MRKRTARQLPMTRPMMVGVADGYCIGSYSSRIQPDLRGYCVLLLGSRLNIRTIALESLK